MVGGLSLSACVFGNSASRPSTKKTVPAPQKAADRETNGAVARLTPEQMVASLRDSLDIRYGYEDPATLEVADYMTAHLAVPLGGVDFQVNGPVRKRDRLTKAQSLLVARSVAWPVAIKLIEREEQFPKPANSLFTKCSFTDDPPDRNAETRRRFREQLDDFYIRLFNRSPSEEELALHESTFTKVYKREGSMSDAWLVIFYALLSSMETWNTWR